MGIDLYKSLEHKAAAIFYYINKSHIFPNGNKRLSVFYMLIFLYINGKDLSVESLELTEKALEIAKSESNMHEVVVLNLTNWIGNKLSDSNKN